MILTALHDAVESVGKIRADSTWEEFVQHPMWKNLLKIRPRKNLSWPARPDAARYLEIIKYLYYSLVYIYNYFLLYFLYFSSFPILIKIRAFIDLRIYYK